MKRVIVFLGISALSIFLMSGCVDDKDTDGADSGIDMGDTADTGDNSDTGIDDGASLDDDEVIDDTESPDTAEADCSTGVYQFTAQKRGESEEMPLCEYAGDVLLIVNVAANCGYTSQLGGLAQLQETYGDRGFKVLGFFCNQFGAQMGTPAEQDGVCQTYNVDFPIYAEVNVNPPTSGAPNQDPEHPLFGWLKGESNSKADVKWNFEKFLIARDGTFIRRYLTQTTPAQISSDIEGALGSE